MEGLADTEYPSPATEVIVIYYSKNLAVSGCQKPNISTEWQYMPALGKAPQRHYE